MKKHPAYNDVLVKFILSSKLVNIGHVLRLIIGKMHRGERLSIHQWDGSKWYINVTNISMCKKATDANEGVRALRLFLTVEIDADTIIWNCDSKHTVAGGNCGLRGQRWFKFFAENWPQQCDDNDRVFSDEPQYYHKHMHLYGFKRTPARAA